MEMKTFRIQQLINGCWQTIDRYEASEDDPEFALSQFIDNARASGDDLSGQSFRILNGKGSVVAEYSDEDE